MSNFESSIFNFSEHIDRNRLAGDAKLDSLVVVVSAFQDTGHIQKLVAEHLLNSTENFQVGSFDIDQLHDYAGRRPGITLEYDRFDHYQGPELGLYHLVDADGKPFLLLTGTEPSMKWERVASSIIAINEILGIKQTFMLNAVPTPSPHTRPIWVTSYASRPELTRGKDKLPAILQMQSSFSAMLSLRMGQAHQDVTGFFAHVPHYLADIEYPDAAIALVEAINDTAMLNLPLGELPNMSHATRELIASQVRNSEQLQQIIADLEQRYDQFMTQRGLPATPDDLPTADEIGAEVEEFLRGIDDDNDQDDGGNGKAD